MECCHGPQTGEALKNAITNGSVPMKIEALTDYYSILSYLAAAHLKLPAEKGTYFHLAYLREKLVSQLIRSFIWVDTRDMCCDGLTKGSIDRTSLSRIMDGIYNLEHPVHEYIEPIQHEHGLVLNAEVFYARGEGVDQWQDHSCAACQLLQLVNLPCVSCTLERERF